jgi:putative inorganic carbon (hco3(-)) transporter
MFSLVPGKKVLLFGILSVLILLNIFLIIKEIYWLALIPVIIGTLWFILYRPDQVLYLLAFIVPLTVKYDFKDYGLSLSLPAEPIVFILSLFYLARLIITSHIDREVVKKAITIAIIINLAWIFITIFPSTMMLVSLKFFLARVCYILVFYFIGLSIYRDFEKIKIFFWLFGTALLVIVFYSLYRHQQHFFTQPYAVRAPNPFFSDHTIYGAILSLILPVFVAFFLKSSVLQLSRFQKFLALAFVIVMSVGLIFSYSRAAWVSVGVGAAFSILLLLRIKFPVVVVIVAVLCMFIYINWTAIILPLKQKEQKVSSTKFEEHFESISNVTTDASNTERLNRWSCAVRMFKEKPLFGWGPGTFMFKYAPFQLYKDRTIISTNWGTLGNAHSEYFGPLAEQGLIGVLSFIGILLVVLYQGMKLVYHSPQQKVRIFAAALLIGLITYFTHGFLNNFLEIDKAALLFWSYLGMLTAFDLYYSEDNNLTKPT